jgi:dCMP deaminase
MLFSKRDRYGLINARTLAGRSKHAGVLAGVVIMEPHGDIISGGAHSPPRGVLMLGDRLSDPAIRSRLLLCATEHAILTAGRPLDGCELFSWPELPCDHCAALIIQAGIARVAVPWRHDSVWTDETALARDMLEEAGVRLDLIPVV